MVALPLRRENSALVGFLVLAVPRRLPVHVELALAECADTIALPLTAHPGLGRPAPPSFVSVP